MTWQQTLIIAAVPAIVTAVSLLLQQWLTRRHEARAAAATRDYEFFLKVRGERIEVLTRALDELSEMGTEYDRHTAAAISGRTDDEVARWPRKVETNHDLMARTSHSVAALTLCCESEVVYALRDARSAHLAWGARLQTGKDATVEELLELSGSAGEAAGMFSAAARRELTPPAPAGAAAQPPRRGPLARVKGRGQPGSP